MKNNIFYIALAAVAGVLAFSAYRKGTGKNPNPFAGSFGTSGSGQLPKVSGTSDVKRIADALRKIQASYGQQIARWVEQIYRKETADFSSKQFLYTGSAGMEMHSGVYPYGWTTPAVLWNKIPDFKPIGAVKMRENLPPKAEKNFLRFKTVEAGMSSLAEYLKRYKKPGRWYSTNPEAQARYENELSKIRTIYT